MSPTRRDFLRQCGAVAAGLAVSGVGAGCAGSSPGRATGTSAGSAPTSAATDTTIAGPAAVAEDAFFAGYPLVVTLRTFQTFAAQFGVNQLVAAPGLSPPTQHTVVAPNHDTVYAIAVLDLSQGPLVFTAPTVTDRYHVVDFIDAWMGSFGLVGTRATGGKSGAWAIVPPDFDGTIPPGLDQLACPTTHALILIRVRAVDDADAVAASAVARQFELAVLRGMVSFVPPPPAPPMAKPIGTPQATGSNGLAFFDELGDALVADPPVTDAPGAAIAAAARLGVGAGRHPTDDPSSANAQILTGAVTQGLAQLTPGRGGAGRLVNGWQVSIDFETDGGRSLQQEAQVARYGWGPLPADEAVYPAAVHASDGAPLDGSKRYVIQFAQGQQPPVSAFWSLTAYGPDRFLVPNSINRYSVSGQTPGLVTGSDGSLDVYLQHDAPTGHESNWLPVPAGPFALTLRLYLPKAPILDGRYRYPPVTVVS